MIVAFHENLLEPKITNSGIDRKKEIVFSWFFITYYFQLKGTRFWNPEPNLE